MAKVKPEKDDKEIEKLLKSIEKQFGVGTVQKLEDRGHVDVDVIPTGLYSIDLSTGVGGLPRGRIVEIFGLESSGKTTLALNVIKEAQKMGLRTAYIDMENAVDINHARDRIGVDVGSMLFSQPDGGEEALDLLETYVKSGLLGVVVVDSVAQLVPTTEVEGEMGKPTMGLQARLMGNAMRKLVPIVKKSNTLVIFINQVRMKLNAPAYSDPTTTPGGMALPFACGMRIKLQRISWVRKGDKVTGSKVRSKVVKSKVAAPFKSAEFVLSFTKGLWKEWDMVNTGGLYRVIGSEHPIIRRDGNTYFFGEEKIGVGVSGACDELEKNRELFDKINKELKRKDLEALDNDDEETEAKEEE